MHRNIMKADIVPKRFYEVGEQKHFKKNHIIVRSGDFLDNIYILVKGSIVMMSDTINGNSIYYYLMVPPFIMGETHVVYNKEAEITLKCMDNVEVISIDRNTFTNLFKSNIELSKYLESKVQNKMEMLSCQTLEYSTLSFEVRIINFLIEFAEVFGEEIDDKIKINYNLSQQFISNFIRVQRVTIYRFFERLKENNIIEFYNGYYYIKNLDRLKQFALKI